MSGMCFYAKDENKYPLHHEDTKPLFTQVETDYMDKLHAIKVDASKIGTDRLKRIADAFAYAKAKHPIFANAMCISAPAEAISEYVKRLKKQNDEHVRLGHYITAEDIIQEEIYEAFEQHLLGNKNESLDELYQVIAVTLRMIEMVEAM